MLPKRNPYIDECKKMYKDLAHSIHMEWVPLFIDESEIRLQYAQAYASRNSAYAVDRSHIVINKAMFDAMRNKYHIISIFSHELSHIRLDHCLTQYPNNRERKMEISYAHELAADELAMKFLRRAGFSSSLYIEMLKYMRRIFGEIRFRDPTHPLFRDRIRFCSYIAYKCNIQNELDEV